MAVLAVVVCGTLVALLAVFASTVSALLTLAYALTALAPLMAGLVWLAANQKSSFLGSKLFVCLYLTGVLAFWAAAGVFQWESQLLKVFIIAASLILFAISVGLGVLRAR